jgi:hypothetical protein
MLPLAKPRRAPRAVCQASHAQLFKVTKPPFEKLS